jgi:hypothetical protein
MNINTLAEIIEVFEIEIIKSGFHRDTQDYINSLANNQNNIVTLRDIAEKTSKKLDEIYSGDLPDLLNKLLVSKVKPFTNHPHDSELKDLLKDTEIPQANFFQKLNQILSQLNQQIQQNVGEKDKIKAFIEPYTDKQEIYQTDEQKAIISILFKDSKTTTLLKEFTKNLQAWNRILPLYHQILKSSSPEDIEIVTVQNGSIDFLVNIDFDIALDLTEVFKIGFKCFMAYLSYKKLAKPIVDSYYGNKKLIASEKEREKELINNIGEAVMNKIIEQHKDASKKDKDIDKNIDKKLDQVVKLVTSHILKGNDIRLLALPAFENDDDNEENNSIKEELRTVSSEVRQAMKIIPPKEMKALLEKYSEPDEEKPNPQQ